MRRCDRLSVGFWRVGGLRRWTTCRRIAASSKLAPVLVLNFRFYPRGAQGVASELSCEMLKIASGKPKAAALNLVQNDAELLPFKDASFEAAFATLVFCSVASPQKAFAELRRVVKPGGTIVLLEHVRPNGLLGPVFDLLSFFTTKLCADHFNRRTAAEAERAGLRVLRVERRLQGIFNLIVLERR